MLLLASLPPSQGGSTSPPAHARAPALPPRTECSHEGSSRNACSPGCFCDPARGGEWQGRSLLCIMALAAALGGSSMESRLLAVRAVSDAACFARRRSAHTGCLRRRVGCVQTNVAEGPGAARGARRGSGQAGGRPPAVQCAAQTAPAVAPVAGQRAGVVVARLVGLRHCVAAPADHGRVCHSRGHVRRDLLYGPAHCRRANGADCRAGKGPGARTRVLRSPPACVPTSHDPCQHKGKPGRAFAACASGRDLLTGDAQWRLLGRATRRPTLSRTWTT
jgi:hypothetical protein